LHAGFVIQKEMPKEPSARAGHRRFQLRNPYLSLSLHNVRVLALNVLARTVREVGDRPLQLDVVPIAVQDLG
jgi:hypothetical protein